MIDGLLVVVSCGKRKIWDNDQHHGPTPARDAYIGGPFGVNRRYAEYFAERWAILSAKYGFIDPDFTIPANYSVTFKDRRTNPISTQECAKQVGQNGLANFRTVVGLGGLEYQLVITEVFAPWWPRVIFPFAGLRLGPAMSGANRAIGQNRPWDGYVA